MCLNEVHILVYLSPVNGSYGQKASKGTVCAVFDILCGHCNTRSTYFDTFCPSYGTKASKFLLYLTSTVLSVHMCLNKVHILIHLAPV